MTDIIQKEGSVKMVKVNGMEVKLDKALSSIIEKAKSKICQLNGKKFSDLNEGEQIFVTEQAVKLALQVKEKEDVIRAEREKTAGSIATDILVSINELSINKAVKKYILEKLGKNVFVNMRIIAKQAKIEITDGMVEISEDMITSLEGLSADDFIEEFTELRDNKTRESSEMSIVGADVLAKVDAELPMLHELLTLKGELLAKYAYRHLADNFGYGVQSVK